MFLYFLSCFSITFIIIYSKIFKPFRPTKGFFGDLFKCPLCLGFWVSLAMYFITFEYNVLQMIQLSFSSSGLTYLLSMLGLYLEKKAHEP